MDTTLLLAFIQSATEFLPISSSGHLILAEKFGFSDQTLAMDVALHVGTLLAVLSYFWKDIYSLAVGFWRQGFEQRFGMYLIVATIPACIAGYFLNDLVETTLRNPIIIAYTSIFYGVLLWAVDRYAPRQKTLHQMKLRDAFLIGLAQALALIPGTSRSGITMTCARALGITRVESARFSMLLSIPTIFLGAAYVFWVGYHDHTLTIPEAREQIYIGILFSAVFGLLAVWFLMKWLKTASFAVFALYRILLGCFLLVYFL